MFNYNLNASLYYTNIYINDNILSLSLSCFAKYVKSKYISAYYVTCNVKNCIHVIILRYK